MGTRSNIAIENKDGSIHAVYCHWDGYPSGVGADLLTHYTDESKVRELVSNGAISSLGAEIGTKHAFGQRPEGVTTFYHRDRGEKLSIQKYSNAGAFRAFLESEGGHIEYAYLFRNGAWHRVYSASVRELSGKACGL